MSKIGYARVSSKGQNLDRQLEALKNAGCEKIFEEKISGKNMERPQLQELLNYIRDDDEVIIASLDRLSRNYDDIKTMLEQIRSKGAKLSVLDLPQTHTGNSLTDKFTLDMLIYMMSFVAENERQKIRERQAQGIKLAKERGVYKGRKKTYTDDSVRVKEALRLLKEDNDLSMIEIAKQSEMSRSALYRLIKDKGIKRNKKVKAN